MQSIHSKIMLKENINSILDKDFDSIKFVQKELQNLNE